MILQQALGNAAFTIQQSTLLSSAITDTSKKVDTANTNIATLQTKVSSLESSSGTSGTQVSAICAKVRQG